MTEHTMNHQPQAPYATPDDEISLRDLYLILRRGLPLIIGVALLAGIIAFVVSTLLPAVYEAQATVLVTPPPVQVQGPENLGFNPSSDVSFETYETLAYSLPVLEATLAQISEAEMTPVEFRGAGEVEKLIGPERPDQAVPLSVTHTVRNTNPALAAALADAWAQSTLETVRESLLASLSPVSATTDAQIAQLQTELQDIESRYQAFQAQDKGSLLSAQLTSITEQITTGNTRLNELERQIATTEANVTILEQQLAEERASTSSSDPTSDSFLAGMTLAEADAFLQTQLEQSRNAFSEATEALRAFDQEHNIALLTAREGAFTATLAEQQVRLNNIQNELRVTEAKVASLNAELADQPRLLTLVESILDDPTLSEAARTGGLENIIGLRLESEEINPNYTQTLSDLITARTRLASLQAEEAALSESITRLNEDIAAIRSQRVNAQTERLPLAIAADEAEETYRLIRSKAAQLALSSQGERADTLTIRDTSGAFTALQSSLRDAKAKLAGLTAERSELVGQLDGLEQTASDLRRQIASLNQQRTELERELTNARSAYDSVVSLQPYISYVTELVPSNARILSDASVPSEPVGPRRLLNTAIALVLGGMLALLFVFLREAVAKPADASPIQRKAAPANLRGT